MLWFGVIGYGVAALLYGATAVVVTAGRPRNARARSLAAAIAISSVWAAGLGLLLIYVRAPVALVTGLEALHLFAWTGCLLAWLGSRTVRVWFLGGSAAAGLLAVAASLPGVPFEWLGGGGYPALVLMALLCLVAAEQVYRNALVDAQQPLRLLCLAAGAIAAISLFIYAHGTLLGALPAQFWLLRGFASIALLPLLVMGARRVTDWERPPFVSRHVMFYTASLLGVGGYLLAMGVAAYVIRALGGEWTVPFDFVFLAVGIAVLVYVLFTSSIRARLKVFLLKHFYRTKYDYREAWLRLTQSLSRIGDLQQTAANALEGMARLIGSTAGDLWIERDGQRYEWLVSLGNATPATLRFEHDHALPSFLRSWNWVVDSEEYAQEPDRYGTAFGHPDEGLLPPNSVIVPLDLQSHLQGFVLLGRPRGLRSLNFEDHDILKTAGRQVAAVLAQALVQEKLAETRQFEALSRLSAFLMHDLKNIVAEQELVLANAQRFRHRPEFIDDAFKTIRGGTERIKKVLERLKSASSTKPPPGRVDVSKLLMEVRSQCADRRPIPEIDTQAQPVWVRMDRDELASVLLHLVRNAQDATPVDGQIRIGLSKSTSALLIEVSDTGCGMDSTFVRDRLFKPFDSTKGESGMGIGAYQARHIVRLAGGDLEVQSRVGEGTTFTVRLPVAA